MRVFLTILITAGIASVVIYFFYQQQKYLASQLLTTHTKAQTLSSNLNETQKKLKEAAHTLDVLKNEDQKLRNDSLQKEITDIEKVYNDAVVTYEELLKLKEMTTKTEKYDDAFTKALDYLSDRNFVSGAATLGTLKKDIAAKKAEIASSFAIPANVPANNAPPGSGYRRQMVQADSGSYMVDIISADLNSTKVIVDTASDSTCKDNCPVMALGDYASRSGAFAAINGPYFCPASYPSCAGKTNSFDTLIMNKNKVYFNSDNNVYSTVPAVIFSGGSARWVSQSLQWGRDTGVDSVIANQPLLTMGGNITYGGDDEVKRAGKGARSFIGSTGNMVYIGVVYNANVAEVARVMKALGIQNSLNLDSGGSTALWSSGRYLAGPGRALPFGILFVRK